MKKLSTIIVLLLFSSLLFAQKSKVPETVTTAFADKYPNAKNVEWEYDEEDGEWEGEFKMDKMEYEAEFDADGNWLETECEIEAAELAKPVLESVNEKNKLSGSSIIRIEKKERPDGIYYEIESQANEVMKDPKTGKEVTVTMNSVDLFNEKGIEVAYPNPDDEKSDHEEDGDDD